MLISEKQKSFFSTLAPSAWETDRDQRKHIVIDGLDSIQNKLRQQIRVDQKILAEYLRRRLPASERWFQNRWKSAKMLDEQDMFNRPLGIFIPDCFNRKYGYVIEIDGSVHDGADHARRDLNKDRYYRSLGLVIFRVQSFDNADLDRVMWCVRELK